MTKKKQVQNTQSSQNWTANYSQIRPEETADTQALRDWKPQADPSVSYAFSRALGGIKNTFNNPLGADTPQSVRDAIERNAIGELGQQEGQVRAEEGYRNNLLNFDKLQYLDQRTAPRMVQTSGSGTSSGQTVNQEKATPFSILGTLGSAFLF